MLKNAFILLAHGSPRHEANDFILSLCQKCEQASGLRICAAFLNENIVKIDTVVESLITEGFGRIKIFPYFLVPGDHITTDIPTIYSRLIKTFPNTEIILLETFGLSDTLPEIIANLMLKA